MWQPATGRFCTSFAGCLRNPHTSGIISLHSGELAQLGERFNGIEEVSGSIPLFSTFLLPTTASILSGFFLSLVTLSARRNAILDPHLLNHLTTGSARVRSLPIPR
jgi:hypothetical protein